MQHLTETTTTSRYDQTCPHWCRSHEYLYNDDGSSRRVHLSPLRLWGSDCSVHLEFTPERVVMLTLFADAGRQTFDAPVTSRDVREVAARLGELADLLDGSAVASSSVD